MESRLTAELFTPEFEKYRAHLKSYILRITASVADTEDIVQDSYIRAIEKLDTFEGRSSVKTWVFAIASNLAKDNLRAKKRWVEQVTDIAREAALSDPHFLADSIQLRTISPHGQFEIREHITFCFTCISKSLPLEQQICLLLKEVYEFRLEEIARIVDCSESMVKYHLYQARAKMISVFDGRCALINKQGTCHQCSELNGIYNPRQKFQEEAVKIAMVREAGAGNKEKLFDLRMEVIRGIDPFQSNAAVLQLHHLEQNRQVMEKYLEKETS
jgi:RNA polymerase sigma-70 factor, ECF subfamily